MCWGLTGLRCLVLIGRDEEVLETWARAVLSLGSGMLALLLLQLELGGAYAICQTRYSLLQSVRMARAGSF